MNAIPDRQIKKARKLIREIHAAVMAGDTEALRKLEDTFYEIPVELNGGEAFGSADMKDALAAACAAADGEVPLWGQAGRFFLCVDGMPAVVEYEPEHSHQIALHAVLNDTLFISETGYRCMYMHLPAKLHRGKTVDQAAADIIRSTQAEKKQLMIPPADRSLPDDLLVQPFVNAGIEQYLASLPQPGAIVEVNAIGAPKTIGVVLRIHPQPLPEAPWIEVAYFAQPPRRQALPKAVIKEQLVAHELRRLDEQELEASDSIGKYLTIGMVEALEAIREPIA
ncbi:hypothetical protein [Burkholderia sp. LMG 13014]|uniref:hypothetical protein n=1 Tax=Burkholderia sp. LMG 13014 TaxID=2709306 RepID=UPI001965DA27|nr:hypothetical protein [Burkholderia sp. LMG 13014]